MYISCEVRSEMIWNSIVVITRCRIENKIYNSTPQSFTNLKKSKYTASKNLSKTLLTSSKLSRIKLNFSFCKISKLANTAGETLHATV